MTIQRNLGIFDQELKLYGQFHTESVEGACSSAGQARLTPCGPFNAVGVRARNLASHRGRVALHWRDSAILMVQHEGIAHARQHGRQTTLRPDDVYIMDTMAPLEMTVPDASRATCIAVARSVVDSLARPSEAIFGTRISGDEGFGRLISHFLMGLLGDRHTYGRDEARAVADALQSMLVHAVGAPAGGEPRSDCGDQLHGVKAWVVRNLEDPALDVAGIARQFGLSRSALYRLFATAGETPQAWFVGQRLERALHILSNPARTGPSISTTCYALGFNDPAHFSRLFRQRFGASPREVRSGALGRAAREV